MIDVTSIKHHFDKAAFKFSNFLGVPIWSVGTYTTTEQWLECSECGAVKMRASSKLSHCPVGAVVGTLELFL
jgi:hypothetical protein